MKTIVNMEQSYVTAAFFRHRTAERYKAMMQAQQTARLLGEGGGLPSAPAGLLSKSWCSQFRQELGDTVFAC